MLLVERELEARIEAETAAGFRRRRRAAKVARRIAGLPPTLFHGAPVPPAGTEPWTAPASAAPADVIDLPESAVHEVPSTSLPETPAEVVEVVEPIVEVVEELIVEPEPVIEPEPVPVIEPEPEPEPVTAPIAAANWQRPNAGVWVDLVFKSSQRTHQSGAVTWPSGWTPAPDSDFASDSDAAEVGEATG